MCVIHSKPDTATEFFIPIMHCYTLKIPDMLLLTHHSFLTGGRYLQTQYYNRIFHPSILRLKDSRMLLLTLDWFRPAIEKFWICYRKHIIVFQPVERFVSIIANRGLHVQPMIIASQYVIANLSLRSNPSIEVLLPRYCYPYFYVPIHAELSKRDISILFLTLPSWNERIWGCYC